MPVQVLSEAAGAKVAIVQDKDGINGSVTAIFEAVTLPSFFTVMV